MRRITLFLFTFIACSDKNEAAPPPTSTQPASAPASAPAGPFTLGKDEKLTTDNLEKLYKNVSDCAWDSTGSGLTKCPTERAIYDATNNDGHGLDATARKALEKEVGTKMLADASPQVRYAALNILQYRSDSFALIADAVTKEQDANARLAMSTRISGSAGRDPVMATTILTLTNDKDERIRKEVAYGMAHAKGVNGALDKLMTMAKSDTSEDVRRSACRSIGAHGDPKSVKFFKEMLVVATPPRVYDKCLEGLVKLWLDGDNANKDAYKLSLTLITKGPFRQSGPSVELSNYFNSLPETMKESPDDWKKKPFVKVPEIGKALLAAVKAKDADVYLREALVEALPKYGIKKKELVAVRKSLPKTLPDELKSLADKLDETIKTTK